MSFDAEKISVVICVYTFDRYSEALGAVSSIERQSLAAHEVIVVVDHNAKLHAELGASLPPSVILIENKFERGLSGARNTGVAASSGDVIAFVDDDAIAEGDCLKHLAARFDRPEVLGVGALISPLYEAGPRDWFPEEFLWVVGCSYRGLEEGATRNLLGACMSVRRSIFEQVGLFQTALGRTESNLPLGNEETELCIRATQANPGGHFIFTTAAKAGHKVPEKRLTWSYFIKRCYAEGLSKAMLTDLVGSQSSLSTEKSYVTKTLSEAIARNVKRLPTSEGLSALLQIVAILVGFVSTAAGYGVGRIAFGSSFKFIARLRAAVVNQKVLFFGASMLALGTAISSALGFIYWWAAAREFPAEAVGYAAAGISLMNFIGHLGEVGFGALLIGEMHNYEGRANRVVTTGLLIALFCSAAMALLYMVVSTIFPVALGELANTGRGQLVFVLGCALTGLTLVLDQAMVGLSQTANQVFRNVAFAVVKLVLLVALPLLIIRQAPNEIAILASWVIGQIASLVFLAVYLRRRLALVVGKPDVEFIGPLLPRVLGHHGLNLANLAPSLLLPFIVTVVLTPSINAAFYAAWTLINVAFLAPASLATIVFAAGTQNPSDLPAKLRASMGSSTVVAIVVAIICALCSYPVLSLFNHLYADLASTSFKILGLSLFPIAIKYHYVAVQRLQKQMASASVLVALGCVLEIGGAIFGGLNHGLVGLSIGWLCGLTIEATLMAPAVIRALDLNLGEYQSRLFRPGQIRATGKPERS